MAQAVTVAKTSFDWRSWPVVSAAIAALTLGAGYADLWRGRTTVAPLLITLGYLVLVPVAVLAVPRTKKE